MNFIKNIIFSLLYFIVFSIQILAMDEPEEHKIYNKTLANNVKWEDSIYNQTGGTCASHAVADCLKYVHGLKYINGTDDIMPYYLHKNTHYHYGTKDKHNELAHQHYDTGHSVKNLMTFCRDYGVPETPEQYKELVPPESILEFPFGTTKYAFKDFYNVFSDGPPISKVKTVKEALVKYGYPIVINVMSTKVTEESGSDKIKRSERIFLDNTRDVPIRLIQESSIKGLIRENIYHSVVAYGYSNEEEGFLIKNSWGLEGWGKNVTRASKGKAILSYDYFDKYCSEDPYIGWGTKFINKDYLELKYGWNSEQIAVLKKSCNIL